MAEDKKPSGSRPKLEPEEAKIGTTIPVQVVAKEKEIKAALLSEFNGSWKNAKKFLREVKLYIVLNPKAFKTGETKALFLLSYIKGGPAEFWKDQKTDELLDNPDLNPDWGEFTKDFKTSFEPLNTMLEAQMKLCNLKMKE
ncbi:hypothetical protein Moror_11152 [Moniliophthora roreri MCA 2997]|nr:hypothetical protein Moror_11152 [Moniliophthora roreri MCA 2997]